MTEYMRSTDDERTVNNVMRHEYRKLSEAEKEHMQRVKDDCLKLWELLHDIGNTPYGPQFGSRELSLAATSLEEVCMWAVKHITK